MRIFISWSGDTSKAVAQALREWIPNVIQAVRPWVSEVDLFPGERWSPTIAEKLEEIKSGIVCLTPENLNAPWIHFEAGAISKVSDAILIPYLLSVEANQVPAGPLTQFQAVRADQEGTKNLLESINRRLSDGLSERQLAEQFEMWWPRLKEQLDEISASIGEESPPPPDPEELLMEIRTTVRRLEQRMLRVGRDAGYGRRVRSTSRIYIPSHVTGESPVDRALKEAAEVLHPELLREALDQRAHERHAREEKEEAIQRHESED